MPLNVLVAHAPGEISPAARALAAALAGLPDPCRLVPLDELERTLRCLADEGRAVGLIALPADLARPFATVRRLAGKHPQLYFLVEATASNEAALRREALFGGAPGARLLIADPAAASLQAGAARLLATARQQQRLRTTLSRMRLQSRRAAAPDADEVRRLVASDRYLASILANASDAIVSLRADGSVASWNHGAEALFGARTLDTPGLRLASLFETVNEFETALASAALGRTTAVSLTLLRDARRLHVDARLDPIDDDLAFERHTAVILRDVSELRATEAALRESGRQKDAFLAMLAHELRNPLAPIRHASELLRLIDTPDPRSRKACAIIRRQVDHMSALIDDLLDIARVTRGVFQLDLQPVDLGDVMRGAVEQAWPLIEQKRQHLVVPHGTADIRVLGDAKRLTQALANLLNNATKFTPAQGRIEVRLAADADDARIEVIDDGIGIEQELLAQVFELFTQGRRTLDRSQEGLGLGLALVRTLARLHGGDVTAHSAGLDRGSRFVLRLPRLAAQALAGKATEALTVAPAKPPAEPPAEPSTEPSTEPPAEAPAEARPAPGPLEPATQGGGV